MPPRDNNEINEIEYRLLRRSPPSFIPLSDQRWKQFAESRFAHKALEFLCAGLPDSDPGLVYTNLTFRGHSSLQFLSTERSGVFAPGEFKMYAPALP